ncbi:unnamed protein product [Toxocara canis]|uniref:MADF domain-containing protein n=1 Tax=Toxocara canis TaxID=6265 RepID=A0A183VEG8_TOXCA|nr:unnamed protein product [Toxocara canis]
MTLIREVRMRPRLWAPQQNTHRDPATIATLRRDIAQVMSNKFNLPFTGDDIARQWKYLKDQHKRYLRKRQRFESDDRLKSHKVPVFQYAKIMNFLVEESPFHASHVTLDSSQSSLCDPQQPQPEVETRACSSRGSDSTQDEDRKEIHLLPSTMATIHDASFSIFEQQLQQDNSHSRMEENTEWRNGVIASEQMSRKSFDEACTFQQTCHSALDEHEQFGKTVTAALRRAAAQNPAIAQRFRIGVTKMLVELEEEVMVAITRKQ